MIAFAEATLAMLILPFLIGFVHLKLKNKTHPNIIYYRYFIIFNVVMVGIFVAARVFMESQEVPEVESSIYDFYAIALISMIIMALITLFSRHQLMLAPALCWVIFMLLSTMMHLIRVSTQNETDLNVLWIHVAYNAIVTLMLIVFVWRVKKTLKSDDKMIDEQRQECPQNG